MKNGQSTEKIIQLLENQLEQSNEQVKQLTNQIESLTQQVKNLTKLLYGSKSEKSKYNTPDGQGSLFDDDSSFSDSEHTEEQSVETITYTVVRKKQAKKRNDSFPDGVEIEEIHHHPEQTTWSSRLGPLFSDWTPSPHRTVRALLTHTALPNYLSQNVAKFIP